MVPGSGKRILRRGFLVSYNINSNGLGLRLSMVYKAKLSPIPGEKRAWEVHEPMNL